MLDLEEARQNIPGATHTELMALAYNLCDRAEAAEQSARALGEALERIAELESIADRAGKYQQDAVTALTNERAELIAARNDLERVTSDRDGQNARADGLSEQLNAMRADLISLGEIIGVGGGNIVSVMVGVNRLKYLVAQVTRERDEALGQRNAVGRLAAEHAVAASKHEIQLKADLVRAREDCAYRRKMDIDENAKRKVVEVENGQLVVKLEAAEQALAKAQAQIAEDDSYEAALREEQDRSVRIARESVAFKERAEAAEKELAKLRGTP